MLYAFVLTIHILVCFVLIAVILLQAGRGGGVADAFGGTAQSILGTRGASILTRATTVCAVFFMLTSLGLAILSAQQGRSLMHGARPRAQAPIQQPVQSPAPMPPEQKPAPEKTQQPAKQP